MSKIHLISLGCAKNQVNAEQMLYLLEQAGYELTEDIGEADAAVVNTCGFIESAKKEAEKKPAQAKQGGIEVFADDFDDEE